MKTDDLAIVLVSGGMDSVTVAAMANEKHEKLAFLHLDYGQKTKNKEKQCFDLIAKHYNIPLQRQKVVDMSFLQQIGGSSLTDDSMNVTDFQGDSDEIPSSYVPFRNTHIIAIAVSWAEILGASKIYIGANYEDSPGYPDCRPEYYEAYNKLIAVGTKDGGIEIETPVLRMNKTQIIEEANKLNAPLELSWSCYAREDKACGTCDSCSLRLRAFKKLNLNDPIDYL